MGEATPASLSGLFRMALVSGPPALVLTHLRRGADVNARDADGATPLMIAMARGRADICQLLLDEGADPRLIDQAGRSALSYAQPDADWPAGLAFSSSNDETMSEPDVILEADSLAPESNLSEAANDQRHGESSLVDLDLGGWEPEAASVAPFDDMAMRQASTGLQVEIARHRVIDRDPDWVDVDIDLPMLAPRRVRNPVRLREMERLRRGFRQALLQGSYAPEEIQALLTGDPDDDEGTLRRLDAAFGTLAALGTVREEWVHWRPAGSPARGRLSPETIDEACEYFELHWSCEDIVDASIRRLARFPPLKAEEDRQAWRRYDLALQALCAAITESPSACAELAQELRTQARRLFWTDSNSEHDEDKEDSADGQTDEDEEDLVCDESPAHVWSDDQLAGTAALLIQLSQPHGTDHSDLRDAFLAEVQERRLPGSLLIAIPSLTAEAGARSALATFLKARDVLFDTNSRLAMWLARRYGWSRLPLEDRYQEASQGLLKAIDRFDPRRGNKFSTYAVWWIRQSVTRAIADLDRVIRLPVHLQETLRRVDLQTGALTYELGRDPTPAELAVRLAMPEDRLVKLLRGRTDAIAFDDLPPAEGDEETARTFVDEEANPERIVARSQLEEILAEILLELSPREERIVRQRFGLKLPSDMTLEEIGTEIEVTRERIRQIEAKALRRMAGPAKSRRLRPFLEGGV
ncbi:sigma-70 family RNA polymerase sigma factor [Xanthobacter sp. V2C-8]|uniref:sigma-70 family RNA polymerase sigma factor n=1 Tax=Xanthobacter albus TaxID=3119929 RepID=UPI00372B80D5